jgi:hypothetical protein
MNETLQYISLAKQLPFITNLPLRISKAATAQMKKT